MSEAAHFLRVECSTVEDVRRTIFSELALLPARQRSVVAVAITRRLRDARLLRSSAEECYEAGELASLWGRSREWVVRTFYAAGTMPWGTIHRDGGGWLIPASVTEAYLAAHVAPEKVAAQKSARDGLKRGGRVLQRQSGVGAQPADVAVTVAFGRMDAPDCADAVTAGSSGLAGGSGV